MLLNPRHPLVSNPPLTALLNRLHALSLEQEAIKAGRGTHFPATVGNLNDGFEEQLVALDEDKARFMYQTLRTMNATRVVEAGTSLGVSLLWLLAAVEANLVSGSNSKSNLPPLVIGTELSPKKGAIALSNVEAGFNGIQPSHLYLLVGDLIERLSDSNADELMPAHSVDFLLLDIWAPLALPTLKAMLPKLRKGACIFIDNSVASADRYEELLSFIRAEGSKFTSETVPFSGGLEMCIYDPIE